MNAISNACNVWPATGLITPTAVGAVPELGLPTTAGRLTWVGAVRRSLEQLLELDDNWDGRGSRAVSPDTALFAFQLLTQTMPPSGVAPAIVPLGNGALQLEWHTLAADLEVEVGKPNSVSVWYASHESDDEQAFEATTDFLHLADLTWLVAKG